MRELGRSHGDRSDITRRYHGDHIEIVWIAWRFESPWKGNWILLGDRAEIGPAVRGGGRGAPRARGPTRARPAISGRGGAH